MGQRVLLRCAGARPRFHSDPLAKESAQGDTAPPTGRGVEPVGFWDPQELSEGCGLLKFLHLRFEAPARHSSSMPRSCSAALSTYVQLEAQAQVAAAVAAATGVHAAAVAAAACAQQLQATAAADGPPPAGWAGFGPPGVGRSAGAHGGPKLGCLWSGVLSVCTPDARPTFKNLACPSSPSRVKRVGQPL